MKILSKVQGVIFDFDGVLFDTEYAYFQVYHCIADGMGVPRFKQFSDWRKSNHTSNGKWRKIFIDMGIKESLYDEAEKIFEENMYRFNSDIKPFEGILHVVKELQAKNIKIGIVSSNYEEYIRKMCKEHSLPFDALVGYEYGILKPHPDPLLQCVRQLNLQKEHVIYIGDMRVDIETGKKAEIKTLTVTYGFEPESLLQTYFPDILIRSPFEILDYV